MNQEHNLTHDFEMREFFKIFAIFFKLGKENVKVFSYHLMRRTALRAPFFMAKLQKPESNGYANHTVLAKYIVLLFLARKGSFAKGEKISPIGHCPESMGHNALFSLESVQNRGG